MKMVSVLVVSALSVCAAARTTAIAQERPVPARATVSAVEWLGHDWHSAGGSMVFEERWTPPAGGVMLGVARTLKGDRMVAFEFLRIVERDGGLVYIAQPDGRPPTEFVLTAASPNQVTFENPAHDFPKVIRYTLKEGGTLEAQVSDGAQKKQTFVFTRERE